RVVIPALAAHLTSLTHQHGARRELLDALEDRERRRRVAIAKKEIEGHRVDIRASLQPSDDGPHLRSEPDGAAVDRVVDELDAHRAASAPQPLSRHIPDRHPEHAVETVEDVRPPLLVAVDDDLGVGLGPEPVATALQLAPELLEVVDLAVEDDPHGFLDV